MYAATALLLLLALSNPCIALQSFDEQVEKSYHEQHDLQKLQHLMKVLSMEEEALDIFQRIERKSNMPRYVLNHAPTSFHKAANDSSSESWVLTGDCTEDAFRITNVDPQAFCTIAQKECRVEGVLFNYIEIPYCILPHYKWLAVILLVGWLMVLLIWLATTVDFLCPNLITATKLLGISDSMAGLTFLAIGNGCSDISSMISAALSGPHGLEMAIAEVLGNGMFVFCFVQGLIALIFPFVVLSSEFLRDCGFYMVGLIVTFIFLTDGNVTISEAFTFFILYLAYICIVLNYQTVLGLLGIREVEAGIKSQQNEEGARLFEDKGKVTVFRFDENVSPAYLQVLNFLNPIDMGKWNASSWSERAIEILKSPAVLVQRVSVPVLDHKQPNMLWNQKVTICQMIVGPIIVYLLMVHNQVFPQFNNATVQIIGLLLATSVGISMGISVYCTSSSAYPPDYYPYLCFLGFAMSVQWIYTLSDEIVNLILVIGVTCHFDKALLGATILAVGVGLQDLVTNIGVCRSGHPNMAAAACVGSPLLNLVLGLGSACIVGNLFVESPYPFLSSIHVWTYLVFLMLAIIVAVTIMAANHFQANEFYAFSLIALYVAFVLVSVVMSLYLPDSDNWPPAKGLVPFW